MAWNEPGGGNKDPWGQGGGNQGPPDLDEVIRKMQAKLGGVFGGGLPGNLDSFAESLQPVQLAFAGSLLDALPPISDSFTG